MLMVEWKSSEISQLLRTRASNVVEGDDSEDKRFFKIGKGNIAFAVFLEPSAEADPNMTFGERVIDGFIQAFSQKPTMVHTEIVIPPFMDPKASKIHFATYLGSHADYQNEYDKISGVDFYLIRHGHRWRCLPVFGEDAVGLLREACDKNVGSPYSLMKYPTSSHYFRKYSWIWKDRPKYSGHCATLTARVLKQAGICCGLEHSPPWYSPSSLYSAIQTDLQGRLDEDRLNDLKSLQPEECQEAIETILRGPLSARSIQELGHDRCVDAIRELSYRVVKAAVSDDISTSERKNAERELGDAVFKWCLLAQGT